MNDPHGWVRFWELWRTGRWEPATRRLLKILGPGDLFVDIGAWIGPVTLWALQRTRNIVAVEPDPVASVELHKTCDQYGIDIWEGAVTVEPGPVHLATNPKDGGALGDSMSRLGIDGVLVEGWTLQHILHGRIPKLVKIDVEGYETELAPTILPWLAANRVAVQVSCHGTLLDRELFAGYSDVTIPDDTWGDIVALP